MTILTNTELTAINGGGISLGALSLIGAGITLLIGIIDGFLRPLACRR